MYLSLEKVNVSILKFRLDPSIFIDPNISYK